MLHRSLWEENLVLAKACLSHPFVRGLADGSLDREAFRRYVAQDAFFLRAFVRAYAIGAARCEDAEHAQGFYRFMGGAFEELKLHARYSASLGIELDNVEPMPAASAYTNFLLRTAWHESVAELAAAMAPCMRLYAYLGAELAKSREDGNPYDHWIETYSSSEFQQLAGDVEALLDAVAEDTPTVRRAYRYAMECEFNFFSAQLGGG
jgi:thiaminase/transcriptional activator TenA